MGDIIIIALWVTNFMLLKDKATESWAVAEGLWLVLLFNTMHAGGAFAWILSKIDWRPK